MRQRAIAVRGAASTAELRSFLEKKALPMFFKKFFSCRTSSIKPSWTLFSLERFKQQLVSGVLGKRPGWCLKQMEGPKPRICLPKCGQGKSLGGCVVIVMNFLPS